MPRKKPTTKLGVYGQFDLDLTEASQQYTISKQQDKYFIKPPHWDLPREGLELTAILNEREHVDYKQQHFNMRGEAIVQEKSNEKRIEDVRHIQNQLRTKFIEVNDFIKDCEEKELTADKKINIERDIQSGIKKEMDDIRNHLEILTDFDGKLEKTADIFKPYEEIIEQVVAESDLFKSAQDLMDRCDSLMTAQVEISDMDLEKVKAIENMRQEMIKATNEAALTVMGLNNELADLEKNYNLAQNTADKWEKILATTKKFIADNELTTYRLIDSIRQLYNVLLKRNRGEEENILGPHQYEEMLDYIKNEMSMLLDIVKMSHEKIELEQKSLQAEKGHSKQGKQ